MKLGTFMIKRGKNKKGFTLIELIIVIAILAILALIGLPLIGQFRDDATLAADNATCQVIGRAAEAYIAAHDGGLASGENSKLTPYLNSNAQAALSTGGFSFTVTSGDVTVTGPTTGGVQAKYPAVPTT